MSDALVGNTTLSADAIKSFDNTNRKSMTSIAANELINIFRLLGNLFIAKSPINRDQSDPGIFFHYPVCH